MREQTGRLSSQDPNISLPSGQLERQLLCQEHISTLQQQCAQQNLCKAHLFFSAWLKNDKDEDDNDYETALEREQKSTSLNQNFFNQSRYCVDGVFLPCGSSTGIENIPDYTDQHPRKLQLSKTLSQEGVRKISKHQGSPEKHIGQVKRHRLESEPALWAKGRCVLHPVLST